MAETRAQKRQVLRGTVVSTAMDKTAVVEVTSLKAHPVYKKRYRKTKRYYAHDENNECQVGDIIRIAETRPLSKKKRWRLLEVIEKAR
ncbi:MAG: 30S ribosomal protein S17 [Candidatus Fermentibacteraceae bacterium]